MVKESEKELFEWICIALKDVVHGKTFTNKICDVLKKGIWKAPRIGELNPAVDECEGNKRRGL